MTAPAWALGYDVDALRAIEARFADYNAYSRTRFTEVTTAAIARGLDEGRLHADDVGAVMWSTVRVGRPIRAYPTGDVVIGYKQPGDRVVDAFTTDNPVVMADRLDDVGRGRACWVWIWQESATMREIVYRAGYRHIGTRVTSAAELRGLYFRDTSEGWEMFPREHPTHDPAESLGISRTTIRIDNAGMMPAVAELGGLEYADHYSSYNVRRSWSALSLRGYSPDPSFIIKPSEMSKAWRAEHDGVVYVMQNTTARFRLRAIDAVHTPLTSIAEPHRIRLMRLTPGGGELRRHADTTDPDSGIGDGRVARFHFPLVTNDDVLFTSWDAHGRSRTVNMAVGECWYLDTRKPHAAINEGTTDRIHLVVDVVSNPAVRAILEAP